MPQFEIHVRNAVQWGVRQVRAESALKALEEARRLIEDDPTGFEMFYDGEFSESITEMSVYESGRTETVAEWRKGNLVTGITTGRRRR